MHEGNSLNRVILKALATCSKNVFEVFDVGCIPGEEAHSCLLSRFAYAERCVFRLLLVFLHGPQTVACPQFCIDGEQGKDEGRKKLKKEQQQNKNYKNQSQNICE